MATCTICNKPIYLRPSAKERSEKFGGSPADYTKLFTMHSSCQVDAWYNRGLSAEPKQDK